MKTLCLMESQAARCAGGTFTFTFTSGLLVGQTDRFDADVRAHVVFFDFFDEPGT